MAKGENIYKRKDGRWEGRYKKGYDSNRKIKYGYCYGHSYKEAKEKLDRAKADFILNPLAGSKEIYRKNFAEYGTQWMLINESRLKKSTLAKYQSILENHIKPQIGYYTPAELDSVVIADFSKYLLYQKRLSSKTVRDILTFVHKITVYIYADSRQNLPPLIISYPKRERKELRVLTKEEQRLFTQYLLSDLDIYKFSMLLALFTGLRIGEICALQWKHISMEAGLLTVSQTVQRIKNMNKQAENKTTLQLGTPKTLSSARTIPLTDRLIDLLKIFCTDDPENFIITGSHQFMEPRNLQRRLKKYTDELHLSDVHFHTLRHTFATRCIECGCDIKILSEMLGHSNISTTLNCYVHPSLDFKRENIIKLEQAGFFPPSPKPSEALEIL